MQTRSIKFKLYPNAKQEALLLTWLDLHRDLYNAALEQRMFAWKRSKKRIGYTEQISSLSKIKTFFPEYLNLGDQALCATLKKVAEVCNKFYIKPSEPFPKLKSPLKFKTITYDHPQFRIRRVTDRSWKIGLPNLGQIRARGNPRVDVHFGTIKLINITLKMGNFWELFLLVDYEDKRLKRPVVEGNPTLNINVGLADNVMETSDGFTVEYPKEFLRLQKEENALIKRLPKHSPRTCREKTDLKRFLAIRRSLHRKRHDLLHQLSAVFVARYRNINIAHCKFTCANRRHQDFVNDSNVLMRYMLSYKFQESGGNVESRLLSKKKAGQGLAKMPKHRTEANGIEPH